MLRLFDNKDLEGPKLSREQALELYILGKDASLESIEDLNKRLDQVSMEYFKIDWPQFFLGTFNTIYRALTADTIVTRNNLGLLAMSFLDRKAKALTVIKNASKIAFGFPVIGPGWLDGVLDATRRSWAGTFMKKSENIYIALIIDVDKVKFDFPEVYESVADASIEIYLKNIDKVCPPCSPRKANTTELKEFKLLDYSAIQRETTSALARLSQGISTQPKDKQEIWKRVIAKAKTYVEGVSKILEDSIKNKID